MKEVTGSGGGPLRPAKKPAKKAPAKKAAAKKAPAKKGPAKKGPAKAAKKMPAKKAPAKKAPPKKAAKKAAAKKATGPTSSAAKAKTSRARGLPAPPTDPLLILGLQEPLSIEQVRRAWRSYAAKHHPDNGGDSATFTRGHAAYLTLRSLLGS
ncbi:hypothetical protein MANY_13180 [Mycolicibacterium anyangense]|uniref:J domain-containing protein n=1 Tax=Mycolicibacterium anyangense TaxID=1431246 RepID=A0A6N4W9L6_9MYCO|nr:J domain-containing protein [Mycolicibacterium anyangense]BBZ75981.1 hypothetical protein MANY_13180 [Mycolicibacterium anyangense]